MKGKTREYDIGKPHFPHIFIFFSFAGEKIFLHVEVATRNGAFVCWFIWDEDG